MTLTGSSITWSSSDATKVSVSASGVITGVAGGSATLTATDAESGRRLDIPVVCLALTGPSSAPTLDVGGSAPVTVSLVGPTNTAVTWSVLEGASGGSVDAIGNYTAPALRGVYQFVATSVFDPNRYVTVPVTVTAGGVTVGVN